MTLTALTKTALKLSLTMSLLAVSSTVLAGFGARDDLEIQLWNLAAGDLGDHGLHLNLGPLDDGDPGNHPLEGWIMRVEDRNTGNYVFLTVQGAYFGIHQTSSQPFVSVQTGYNSAHDLLVYYRIKRNNIDPFIQGVAKLANGAQSLADHLEWMAPTSLALAPAVFYQDAADNMDQENYTLIEHSDAPTCLRYMVEAGAAALRFMAEDGDPQELVDRLIELRSATDDHLLHTNNCTVGPQ